MFEIRGAFAYRASGRDHIGRSGVLLGLLELLAEVLSWSALSFVGEFLKSANICSTSRWSCSGFG